MRWVCLLLLIAMPSYAQNRSQARSMVISRLGIVATSQTLASQAGAQVLARGGSAMDAAIAANAALGVVEPMSNGIGGDLFAIYWESKSGKLTGINASGWAPAGYTVPYLRAKSHYRAPDEGIDAVTVPGCVAGWERLHKKFGRLPFRDLLRPAMVYAAEGFPVTEIIQEHWRASTLTLSRDDNARALFLPNGSPPGVGEIFRNPPLAKALGLIAAGGAGAFYDGPIAQAILKTSQRLGGAMAAPDLSQYQPEWVEPVSTEYRGWKVYELPPNGQGIAALEMLNILETLPLPSLDAQSADALHLKIEAQKLAYADLIRYIADPRFAQVPVAGLLSKPYAAGRAALIQRDRARCDNVAGTPPRAVGDTIYLSVVDRDGNIASLIQSLYLSFGSGVLVDGFGFHLQNRAALFEMDEQHPNVAAPRKRPLHTIIPAFAEKGDLRLGFGIMGGFNPAQAHAQFISHMVDHGMNIQAALEAPRFTKLSFGGCDVMMEARIPAGVREELASRGHRVEVLGDYSGTVGGGQAVLHDSRAKVNYGASSPRKDGAAIPEPA
ncbi:MAG: gamma-glutamyltransferase, partial [Candidatus Solibacter usitatus]|nr:gamma-glutamyltransferase [Candidatus Solibacter usitatus]